ncbi:hypothetical protein [Kaarinaea lacus]
MSDGTKGSGLLPEETPIEIALVKEVKQCRRCDSFWSIEDCISPEPVPRFGPYPSFSFSRAVGAHQSQPARHQGIYQGKAGIDPAIQSGCRKAPIMTIGINPNLTAYWPGQLAASWAYPKFSRLEDYAHYYRYHSVYQESLSLDFIREQLDTDHLIRARAPGYLVNLTRHPSERCFRLQIHYSDPHVKDETLFYTWEEGQHFVCLFDPLPANSPVVNQFDGGEPIAGLVKQSRGGEGVEVYDNLVGYNNRLTTVLTTLQHYIREQGYEDAVINIAEDVAQLDMVACASPIWNNQCGIDIDKVKDTCVTDQQTAWAFKQLLHTQPAVVIFAGDSAVGMIDPECFDPPLPKSRGKLDLLIETTDKEYYLNVKFSDEGIVFRARLIVAPHFSYDDNFRNIARLDADQWSEFEARYPEFCRQLRDWQLLTPPVAASGVTTVTTSTTSHAGEVQFGADSEMSFLKILEDSAVNAQGQKYYVIDLSDRCYPFMQRDNIHAKDAMACLVDYSIKPYERIEKVLIHEYKKGRLHYDSKTGHLQRTEGGCRFCVNEQWRFPEGCIYGKDKSDQLLSAAQGALLASALLKNCCSREPK